MLTEANLQQVAEQSQTAPVIVAFVSGASPSSAQLADSLERIIGDYAGRFAFAVSDVDAAPQIAQALQVQAVPTVVALIGARPAPLFQGTADELQIRSVLDQVLEVAEQAGITGTVAAPAGAAEPEPEPLPPLHAKAVEAIDAGDFAGAVAAYEQALRENPKDRDASAGKAQVSLLMRTAGLELESARAAAAADPKDLDAAMAIADLDVAGGHVDDAFGRLIDLVRVSAPDDKERLRTRLVELFEVVGDGDPRVAAARRALASALF